MQRIDNYGDFHKSMQFFSSLRVCHQFDLKENEQMHD